MIKIIAEAGVNHNGSLKTAFRMVDAAAEAGADYIKFQTFKAQSLVTKNCATSSYQKKNSGEVNQLAMLKKLELSHEDFRKLADYCNKKKIGFLSTPFDLESIDFITSLKPDFMKVPSGEITNLPYLRKIATTSIPVIISTGMSTYEDIEKALQPFLQAGYNSENIFLLHCTTQYPTPLIDVNLKAILALRSKFGLSTGYSDHTKGITVPIAAAALEACIIEKHFTLSRSLEGPDHKASLEPHELKEMVEQIRNVGKALGSAKKFVTDSERDNIMIARRSIVAAREIKKGNILTEEDIACKRPATGISPMMWDKVVGSVATHDYLPDDLIEI